MTIKPMMIYWTIGCILLGVIAAPLIYSPKPAAQCFHSNHNHKMEHGLLEVDKDRPIPTLAIQISPDPVSGWNLSLTTTHYTFRPDLVNQPPVPNVGHAHIYVNGEKINRLYGNYYHLPELLPGEYEVSVTLNANDHSVWALNGKPIEVKQTIVQTARGATD